jgi:hypothetical protein
VTDPPSGVPGPSATMISNVATIMPVRPLVPAVRMAPHRQPAWGAPPHRPTSGEEREA